MKYHIIVFGCAANIADGERIAGYYAHKGWQRTKTPDTADEVIIVTCMVRQSAEDRIVGLVHNLSLIKQHNPKMRIIVTGCMSGMALGDKSGKLLRILKRRMPAVDRFILIEEAGFDYPQLRRDLHHGLIPISNGCNNFCSYCVVPYARGREVSRPFDEIIAECQVLADKGYTTLTLLGQNVNSYGADLVHSLKKSCISKKNITYVKHLGKIRIPTLFPHLLDKLCTIDGIDSIDFLSSNPWDFSDELIGVIAKHKKISRQIHLPMQSGDDEVLRNMNRWYTAKEYLSLVEKIRKYVHGVTFSTDIIVGFPGETEEQFQHTVDVAKKARFVKAYIAMYSDRPLTYAHKNFHDTLPYQEKKRRWGILENLINNVHLSHKSKRVKKV